jgi:hypothetical protein
MRAMTLAVLFAAACNQDPPKPTALEEATAQLGALEVSERTLEIEVKELKRRLDICQAKLTGSPVDPAWNPDLNNGLDPASLHHDGPKRAVPPAAH